MHKAKFSSYNQYQMSSLVFRDDVLVVFFTHFLPAELHFSSITYLYCLPCGFSCGLKKPFLKSSRATYTKSARVSASVTNGVCYTAI